ncbi:MAG: HigA family addiction module antitoxin [Bryobacterales bacterium]|nr:HigA family addiction module antitoxin [Bryobacterales bacterium]MDE0629503.1 HigA family addiction module antitoxin [Bryobacterales bacterium]
MLDPSHPGESILLGCLGEGLDAAGAAALLGIPQAVLDEVLAGRAPVTPNLARRMEDVGWSSASFWLRRQAAYDAARARAAVA